MHDLLLNEIYGNFLSTGIALVILLFTYGLVAFIASKKVENVRQRRKVRGRAFYIISFIFIFILARIWVEGFTHLLAVLGLVSAALVITNKETVMNFVGWLIINWRDLFSDDDLVQILDFKGYVKSFGFLYFSLVEVSDQEHVNVTGRVIRVPNGLVIHHPLINFSQTSHLLEQVFPIMVTFNSNVEQAIELLKSIVNQTVTTYYQDNKEFCTKHLMKNHKYLASRINLEAKVCIHVRTSAPLGIELTTRYYCFAQDTHKIQQTIWTSLLTKLKKERAIHLVEVS